MIRKLRVPREDPSGDTLVVGYDEFLRIRNSAKVLTKKEREEQLVQIKMEKKSVHDAATSRKDFMQQVTH